MAGLFFEHESQFRPDTCGCILARDESDHTTEDTHWQSSVFVRQCDAHKAAGTSAPEVHQHNVSKNVAVNAFAALHPGVGFPIYELDYKAGSIRLHHAKLDEATHAHIGAALDAHRIANLKLIR